MVQSMSRCLAFAEGVVTMVCPVLLALALKKINWKKKGKVEEPVVPMFVLVIAGATLITGICPLLACCVSERFPTACKGWPPATRRLAAPFSSACLLALACWISLLIVPVKIVIPIGVAFGLGIVAASFFHPKADTSVIIATEKEPTSKKKKTDTSVIIATEEEPTSKKKKADTNVIIATEEEIATEEKKKAEEAANTKEIHTILDKSHEFLSGVTGILFLGLQGLALEGLISTCHGIQDAVRTPMGISFTVCALGVYLMFLAMVHPLTATTMTSIVLFTVILDVVMVVGTVAILATIMQKLMGLKGLLFFSTPFLIFFQLAYRLLMNPLPTATSSSSGSSPVAAGDKQGEENQGESKVAPLGLTKVTFTGFLAVSVTSISSGSTNEWTDWFLLFAAAAIASGLSWRLLTHTQNKGMVEAANEAANVASFCTHFCIAVATVLFTVMAWEAANKVHVTTCALGN